MRESLRLLERSHETDLVGNALRRARDRGGAMLIFEGASGLGKTSLLRAAREEAAAQEFRVLRASGSEFERDFRWGVVRQLFEAVTEGKGCSGKGWPLSGPAAMAASLFDYRQARHVRRRTPAARDEDDLHSALHGLYWLSKNLSERRPLLITIDDAQWVDVPSLRFVGYLANRLEDAAIAVILTNSPTHHIESGEWLAVACASPLTSLNRLAPLSEGAVREVSEERLGRAPHHSFAEACHGLTEGNPLYLSELLNDVVAKGIDPLEAAAVRHVRELAPRRVALNVLRWMNGLPGEAVRLAGAVAVLAADAEPRHCANVAGLDEADATAMAGRLRDAHILRPGAPYAFMRPIMRQVVYAEMAAEERNAAHQRAARCLTTTGSFTAAAEHLCRTEPGSDPWALEVLRAAARTAADTANPRTAVRYLRRALAEPPSGRTEAHVLAELGAAELRSRDRSSVGHLREALEQTAGTGLEPVVRLDLGQALAASGRCHEAAGTVTAVYDQTGRGRPMAGHEEHAFAALLSRLVRARYATDAAGPATPGSPADTRPPAVAPVGEPARAHAAAQALCRGVPADRVARLAVSALEHEGAREARDVMVPDVALAAWVLLHCDHFSAAEHALTGLTRQALGAGHLLAATAAEGLYSAVLLATGRIAEAESTARRVLRGQEEESLTIAAVPLATAVLAQVLLERDRPAEAEKLLEREAPAGELAESAFGLPVRQTHGRLLVAQGRWEEAARELLVSRRLAIEAGWDHPGVLTSCLPDAALALARTGSPHMARTLTDEAVEQARAFGAARPLAAALRACGELTGGGGGLALLEEADHLLSATACSLDRMHTLIALGAALRRTGHRVAARQRLTTALELAERLGARSAEKAALAEFRLAGGRLRRAHPGPDSPLTPAEQRVVQKAAAGLSNKEIAQVLFVTVKTVEWHLGQAYTKLGIGRRSELHHALTLAGLEPEDAGAGLGAEAG